MIIESDKRRVKTMIYIGQRWGDGIRQGMIGKRRWMGWRIWWSLIRVEVLAKWGG